MARVVGRPAASRSTAIFAGRFLLHGYGRCLQITKRRCSLHHARLRLRECRVTAERLDVFVHHLIDRLGRLRFLGGFVSRACAALTPASWLAGGRSGWRASRPTATRRTLLRRASGLRRRHLERQWRRAFRRRASMVTRRAPHALAALERAGVDVVHHAHHVARGFLGFFSSLSKPPCGPTTWQ